MKKIVYFSGLAVLAGCSLLDCVLPSARTCALTVNHLVSPANVSTPVFAWKMDSDRPGAAQSAYRLKVFEGVHAGTRTLVRDTGVRETAVSTAHRYGGAPLKSATKYTWQVTVRDERGKWLAPAEGFFETGLLRDSDWDGARWISAPDAREATPEEKKLQVAAPGTSCFAKNVPNGKTVREAYWTVTGLGVFEAYVNGEPVSRKSCCGRLVRDFLKPGFTHAFKTRHAFTYDVTHLMKTDPDAVNTFSAMVSAGWWRDKIVKYAGRLSAFRAVLILRHEDGSETRVVTDDSWKAGVGGPVTHAAIFDGEHYDARVETPWMKDAGWGGSGFGAAVVNDEFKGAVHPMEGAPVRLREDLALKPKAAYVWMGVTGALVKKGALAADEDLKHGRVNVMRRYRPDEEMTLERGETLVVDFGQNAAAVPCLRARADRGVALTIETAEMLNDASGAFSRGNDGPEGAVYRTNLRHLCHHGSRARYVFAGRGEECYRPSFTFFGYRYASITATGRVRIAKIRSLPVTSIPKWSETGRFETGVADVNKLVSNVLWGQYSNYLSVPTDCPQRNERLGWCADTQVFCAAAAYNADVYGFLSKWMRDMRDTQHDNGSFPGVAPYAQYGSEASEEIGWSDAGVIVPYTMWRVFGDATIVRENWDAMEKYLALTAKNRFNSPRANSHQWADWLSFEDYESAGGGLGKRLSAWEKGPDGRRRPRAETLAYWHYLGGCYWLWDAQMMAEMAPAAGRGEAAAKYRAMADEAKKYLRDNFIDKSDGLVLKPFRNNQSAHLFALKFGLVEGAAREASAAALLKNIEDHGDCLTTGFLGTSILMDTLTYDVGAPKVAYTLLLQHKNPSWLYSVDQGATTIWERWNSYVKATGFGPTGMNSFNHYAYGAVLSWMYGTMAGIRPDPEEPGYRRFVLAPVPDRRVGRVSAAYDSPYGRIESAWAYGEDGVWRWRYRVPANTTATVKLPDGTVRERAAGVYEEAFP